MRCAVSHHEDVSSASLADIAISSNKSDVVIDAQDVVKKSLNEVVLLEHSLNKLNNVRRIALRLVFQ